MQQSFDYGIGSDLGQRAYYAGERRKRLRRPGVLGALRHLAGDHRRSQRPVELSEGLNAGIVQKAQQIAPVTVSPNTTLLFSIAIAVAVGVDC